MNIDRFMALGALKCVVATAVYDFCNQNYSTWLIKLGHGSDIFPVRKGLNEPTCDVSFNKKWCQQSPSPQAL